jgi:hypothetical protein
MPRLRHSGALRLRLAMEVKRFRRCRAFLRMGGVGPARHCLQKLARILKIAAPEYASTFARETVRAVGFHPVVADDHALRRRRAARGVPLRGACPASFLPFDDRCIVHPGMLQVNAWRAGAIQVCCRCCYHALPVSGLMSPAQVPDDYESRVSQLAVPLR